MVVRVYVSGISGNKEVKKRQQRVSMILESKNIKYNIIDIAEPGKENEKEFMQENSKVRDSKYPLPPQIFNDNYYCGDYEEFDMANELDELEKFLKISSNDLDTNLLENGISCSKVKMEKEVFKEDIHESTEETLDPINNGEVEAVSLGNEVVNKVPDKFSNDFDEIVHAPDEISNTLHDLSDIPEEIPNALDEHEDLKKNENILSKGNKDKISDVANEE